MFLVDVSYWFLIDNVIEKPTFDKTPDAESMEVHAAAEILCQTQDIMRRRGETLNQSSTLNQISPRTQKTETWFR